MDSEEAGIVHLGDARVQTRGVEILGPIEVQTFQRTYFSGMQIDD